MAEQVWGKLRLLGVKTICIFLMKYFVRGGLSSLLILTFAPNASYLSINPLVSFAHSIRCIKK